MAVMALSDKIDESAGPVVLSGITHMAVTGQQIIDNDAVMAAVDAGTAGDFVGKIEWSGQVFQA
jgi:hypothetical protein